MAQPFERTSTTHLNGGSAAACPQGAPTRRRAPRRHDPLPLRGAATPYSAAEVAHRAGISPEELADWERQCGVAANVVREYAAVDVVRLELLGRLLRAGVPPADAATLMRGAQSAG
jgi:hypothetical protein